MDKQSTSGEKNSFGDTAKHEGPKFPTPTMLSSNLYVYLRWLWIQFPWIGTFNKFYIFSQFADIGFIHYKFALLCVISLFFLILVFFLF